jgi:hypothetical protein
VLIYYKDVKCPILNSPYMLILLDILRQRLLRITDWSSAHLGQRRTEEGGGRREEGGGRKEEGGRRRAEDARCRGREEEEGNRGQGTF